MADLKNTPSSPLARQMFASAVALLIMAGGIYTLMAQNAPYHPDTGVTREGIADLTAVGG